MMDALLVSLTSHHGIAIHKPNWPHAPYWFCMAEEAQSPTIADIKIAVMKRFDVGRSSFNSNRRGQCGIARLVAMYLSYRLTDHSHSTIGRSFNKSDHTSSLRASKVVPEKMLRDAELAKNVSELEALFA